MAKTRFLIIIAVLIAGMALSASLTAQKVESGMQVDLDDLPRVGSYEKLRQLLENSQGYAGVNYGRNMVMMIQEDSKAAGTQAAPEAPAVDYSATNVQVEGVDEADIVKTDGRYIYYADNRRVIVARAYPAAEMNIASTLYFQDSQFSTRELYVDAKHLVVIGENYINDPVPLIREPAVMPYIWPPYHRATTKAVIYDISDKSNIKQLREVELEGRYVSSRKIGPALYLVTNRSIDWYVIQQGQKENITPAYRDTSVSDDFSTVDYGDIYYFPGFVVHNYLVIAGIDLEQPEDKMDVGCYLGAGDSIYASAQNLYVAVTRYDTGVQQDISSLTGPRMTPVIDRSTAVYKFALDQGRVQYRTKGTVPGSILNQFSMDEHQGYFRIATTKGDMWREDEYTSKNNVYIMDANMDIAGSIENIAPGERIYSVRFMGDRAYMVTFKNVDPFFVLDLQDPKNPRVLGALKIPGYSDYLHPLDDNHIIGFGKDTVEIPQKDRQGKIDGSMPFYLGMKMAVFDVTDVNNPVEQFKEIIGDRGTDSELLRNHKALLFDQKKNLLAFPVTVMEVMDAREETGAIREFPAYGRFTFQGVYVYHIDLVDGFRLKGRITHLTEEDYLKAGQYYYQGDRNIERVLYIGDNLYTLSPTILKAHAIDSLEEINTLKLPL